MVSPVAGTRTQASSRNCAGLFYDKHFAVYDVRTAFQRTECVGIVGFQYEYALQIIYGYTLVGSRRFGNGGGSACGIFFGKVFRVVHTVDRPASETVMVVPSLAVFTPAGI